MKSIWQNQRPQFDTLKAEKTVDVLIIGGGIAGILCAYKLQEKGVDYLLLEKDKILGGNTANTTAKITLILNTRFLERIRSILNGSGMRITAMLIGAAVLFL